MTMDIANQVKSTVIGEEHLTVPQTKAPEYPHVGKVATSKRSFDVAFLMLPDEKLKQKQLDKQAKLNGVEYPQHQISVKNDLLLRHQTPPEVFDHRSRAGSEEIDIVSNGVVNNNNHSPPDHLRHFRYQSLPVVRLPRIYDDPTILPSPERPTPPDLDAHRSAFTKVPHLRGDSPNPSLSPDQLSCPSVSPPVSVSPPRPYPPTAFRPSDYAFINGTTGIQPQPQNPPSPTKNLKQQFIYRPAQELPQNYLPSAASFPFNATPHHFMQQQSEIAGIVRNPAAAAILSTLIPPTLASTFTLTSQNMCAKCNISFRMTSDLVYHMRSHHKNDMGGDPMRRKREEKLKCPVCNESFRERHHLTRHMTAHQDKESDDAEAAPSATRASPGSSFELTQLHQATHQARRHHKTH
ncbi:uncharacterized protein LOC129793957 [Lutzomyia longipalpis]|uniref:uncharacterized protein LOC129793957 n=1 Tax=Lutzomyia longipalpis TaxID=7200 RepID=UPI00248431D4|nr:uncharacterized protein LOC129793957 [Lutzomyia longipalpis]